jgi:hypothetical protein
MATKYTNIFHSKGLQYIYIYTQIEIFGMKMCILSGNPNSRDSALNITLHVTLVDKYVCTCVHMYVLDRQTSASLDQGDQKSLWKNRPKGCPTYFLKSKLIKKNFPPCQKVLPKFGLLL